MFYEITIRNKVIVLAIKTGLTVFLCYKQYCRIHYPPRCFHDFVITAFINTIRPYGLIRLRYVNYILLHHVNSERDVRTTSQ